MPTGDASGTAGAAWCAECTTRFFVIDDPVCCPYCGSEEVSVGHSVMVRPA